MKQKGQTNEEKIRRIKDYIQHGQTLDVSMIWINNIMSYCK